MHASRPQGGNRLNVDKRRNIAVNTLRNKVLKPLFEPRLDLPHSFFAHVKLAAEIGVAGSSAMSRRVHKASSRGSVIDCANSIIMSWTLA